MKPDSITLISSLAAALFLGAAGAFFLFVSPITIIAVVTMLAAMILMFGLGLLWGRQWRHHASFAQMAYQRASNVTPINSTHARRSA